MYINANEQENKAMAWWGHVLCIRYLNMIYVIKERREM